MIKRDLSIYQRLLKGYTELRLQENRATRLYLVKGNLVRNDRVAGSGASARANVRGAWGFASSSELTEEAIASVLKTAVGNAEFLDSKLHKNKELKAGAAISGSYDYSTKQPRCTQKDIMDFLKQLDELVANKYQNISNRTISFEELEMEKSFINSDGALCYSLIPRVTLSVRLFAESDGKPVDTVVGFGGLGNFEDYFSQPSMLMKGVDENYEHLMNKKEGIYPEAGIKTCILHPFMTGGIVHEAVGHTTEADIVLMGSIAGENLGKQIASPLVTMVDYAHTALGKTCPVPVHFDDEGTESKDAVLIENGVLKGLMHNKETAAHFGSQPTGNARAFEFSDEPLIRMRNTILLPGKDKLEDMIASVEDGYYLIRGGNGQADTTSEFMFAVNMGYEIKNGKLGRAIKDATVSGVAFNMLNTVSMVSDEIDWGIGGYCGKKQMIPVGLGGPAIKCELNIGGR